MGDWVWYIFFCGVCVGAIIMLGIWRVVNWFNNY